MRDELFKYYVNLGHELHYERLYYISSRRINNIISGFLLVVSASSLAVLWEAFPIAGTVIALFAQVIQALQPLSQAAKQRDALRFIIQDKNRLFNDVRAYWEKIGCYEMSQLEIDKTQRKLSKWRDREHKTYMRFSDGIDFPYKKRLNKKAGILNIKYFRYNYDAEIEEDNNEQL